MSGEVAGPETHAAPRRIAPLRACGGSCAHAQCAVAGRVPRLPSRLHDGESRRHPCSTGRCPELSRRRLAGPSLGRTLPGRARAWRRTDAQAAAWRSTKARSRRVVGRQRRAHVRGRRARPRIGVQAAAASIRGWPGWIGIAVGSHDLRRRAPPRTTGPRTGSAARLRARRLRFCCTQQAARCACSMRGSGTENIAPTSRRSCPEACDRVRSRTLSLRRRAGTLRAHALCCRYRGNRKACPS